VTGTHEEITFLAPDNTPEGKRHFRSALGQFATGVAVITTRDQTGMDIGITVNSFSSVSLDPALILWSIGHDSKSLDVFAMHTRFAVNVLAAGQEDVARHFSTSARNQFPSTPASGLPLRRGLGDVPLLGGCLSYFECRLDALLPGGDHTILVGQVERFASAAGAPLLFHCGKFLKLEN
jgi:flavin reductase (DIM6/NTAB) family NADH-FMN oxidoreductase RutF